MATIFTASRSLLGKKQDLIIVGTGSISTIANTVSSYFDNVRPSTASSTAFDLDQVVASSSQEETLDEWSVIFIAEFTDTNTKTPKQIIVPATLKKTGTPPIFSAASVYSDMNTAFKGYQDVLVMPAIDLNSTSVFVKKIICITI